MTQSFFLYHRLVLQLAHTQNLCVLLTIMTDYYPYVLPYESTSQAQPFIPRVSDGISRQSHTMEDARPRYHALPTKVEKLYMSIAAAEAVIVFALAAAVFGLVEVNVKDAGLKIKTVPVYLAIFLLSQVFSLLYVFDALRARNIVQLFLHIWLNLMLLLYAILQIPQTKIALEDVTGSCGDFDALAHYSTSSKASSSYLPSSLDWPSFPLGFCPGSFTFSLAGMFSDWLGPLLNWKEYIGHIKLCCLCSSCSCFLPWRSVSPTSSL